MRARPTESCRAAHRHARETFAKQTSPAPRHSLFGSASEINLRLRQVFLWTSPNPCGRNTTALELKLRRACRLRLKSGRSTRIEATHDLRRPNFGLMPGVR